MMAILMKACRWSWAKRRCIEVEAERVEGQLEGKGKVDHNNSTTNSANHGKTTSRMDKGKAEVSRIKVSAYILIIKIIIKINKITPVGTAAK